MLKCGATLCFTRVSPAVLPQQEQASWVCQCDESVVQRLEQDFKVTLQQQSSLDQWATWLDNVVTQVLKPHQGSPSFPKAARQFLLKWSFYRYDGQARLTDDVTVLGKAKWLEKKGHFDPGLSSLCIYASKRTI